jgi:RNA polymerase sigma-70 factor (ECF subfamily)
VPRGEADDLTQEVFLRLLRYSQEVEVDNPQGYLFRIAANVANEWRERSRVRKPHDSDWLEDLQIEELDQPDAKYERETSCAYISAQFLNLKPRQRRILILHIEGQLTYKQIAKREGVTYRIVLRDLTRAYEFLRKELKSVEAL